MTRIYSRMRGPTKDSLADYNRRCDNLASSKGWRIGYKDGKYRVLSYDCKTTHFVDSNIVLVYNFLMGMQ